MTSKIVQRIFLPSAAVFTLLSGVAIAPAAVQAKTAVTPVANPVKTTVTTQDSESGGLIKELNLTEQQKKEIRQIRHDRTVAINKLLKPDQQAKFKQARAAKKPISQIINELNLDLKQKSQIMAIVQKSANDIRSKLTKTQLAKLNDYIKKHSGRTATVE
jgi:Spy/CpxP family protein refolding chaperone